MATFDQIYDVQTAVESAALLILSSSVGITTGSRSRESDNKTTPYVEVQYTMGAPTGHVSIVSGSVYWDSWNGQLTVMITTDRAVNEVSHSSYVAKCRRTLQDTSQWNTGSTLQYHYMQSSRNDATNSSIDPELNHDMSVLSFSQIVFVKPNVWPSS